MVRGKPIPIRSLTDDLKSKVEQYNCISDGTSKASPHKSANLSEQSLSSLQNSITEAILQDNGSCSLDVIVKFVSKNWIEAKNHTHSALEKAIQVELDKKAPMNLFWRDPVTDNWRLTCTKNAEITVKSPEGSPEISYTYDKKRNDHGDEIQLTPLQTLIAQAIIQNNGAIHFDVLQEYVAENWTGMKGKDGNRATDGKRAILASLSKNIKTQPLFQRVKSTKYWWQLGEYNPLYTAELENSVANMEMIDEPLHSIPKDLIPQPRLKIPTKENHLILTELQIFIIEALVECGGTANINDITKIVSKHWGSLRRRDGSKYTTDCRRAVQASLANNPSSRPIFRKESRKKGYWSLGKRALEYLEQQKANGHAIPNFEKNNESSSESEQEEKSSPVLTPSSTSERASPDPNFGSFKLPPAQVLKPVNVIEAPNSVTIKIDEPNTQLNLPVNYYNNPISCLSLPLLHGSDPMHNSLHSPFPLGSSDLNEIQLEICRILTKLGDSSVKTIVTELSSAGKSFGVETVSACLVNSKAFEMDSKTKLWTIRSDCNLPETLLQKRKENVENIAPPCKKQYLATTN